MFLGNLCDWKEVEIMKIIEQCNTFKIMKWWEGRQWKALAYGNTKHFFIKKKNLKIIKEGKNVIASPLWTWNITNIAKLWLFK